MTQSRAVQFGENVDQGNGVHNRTLPGIFPFFSSDQDQFDQLKLADPMATFTIRVPAGGQITHYVKTPPDYIFKLKRLIFTAYEIVAGVYNNIESFAGYYYDIGGDSQLAYQRPYTRYITMQFCIVSGGERTIIGGNKLDFTSGAALAGQNCFVGLDTLQGEGYGEGSVFCPYLIPAEGTVRFTFRNSFTAALQLTGAMIGTRIRL
jgi:hypothetical protein